MQSYLSAQETSRAPPVSKPHSSSMSSAAYDTHMINQPNSPSPDDVTAPDAASKPYSGGVGSRVYTTPPPSQAGEAPPHFRGSGIPPASYNSTGKAHTHTPAAAARNPGQLVQVKRNVWLPASVVQQAGGDIELALHLAAQHSPPTDSHDAIDSSPTAGKAWTPGTTSKPSRDDPFLSRQEIGQKENDRSSNSIRNRAVADHERSGAYAPWTYSSQQYDNDGMTAGAHHHSQYDSSRMQSHFHSSLSLKTDAAANYNDGLSKFDPTIQPPVLHPNPNQGMGSLHTLSQTTASKQGSGCGFRSPTASLPAMGSTGGSNNAFVSPQCGMEHNSLFSYNVATPEQTVHSRPTPLFATPDTNPTQGWGALHPHNPTSSTHLNPAAYYPELNPSASHLHMGQAYGWGSYPGMHDSSHVGPNAAGAYMATPSAWQEPKSHQLLSQYAASPEAHMPYSNMAAGMGSNTIDDGHSGDCLAHQHHVADVTLHVCISFCKGVHT